MMMMSLLLSRPDRLESQPKSRGAHGPINTLDHRERERERPRRPGSTIVSHSVGYTRPCRAHQERHLLVKRNETTKDGPSYEANFAMWFCFIQLSILCVFVLLHKMVHPLRSHSASYNGPSFAFSFCFIKWSILCVLVLLHKMIHPLRVFSFCFIKWSILCVFVLLQNLLNTLLFVWCCFEDQTRSMEKVMTQRKTAKHGAFCKAHRHIKGWTIL